MLSILTNTASLTAQRNLGSTNSALKSSLEKLSSGLRVNKASDDVASMAIGSRLNAELTALKTVAVNAGQATALTQIAEGTYSRINDMLVRMKSLSAQSANGTLSNTERQLLDVEFQALKDEISRVAADTTFNNQKLINNEQTRSTAGIVAGYTVTFSGVLAEDNNTARQLNLTYTNDGTANAVFDVTIGGVQYRGELDVSLINQGVAATNDDEVDRQVTVTLTSASGPGSIILTIAAGTGITNGANQDLGDIQVDGNGGVNTFDFRIGSGSNPAEDVISADIRGANSTTLGLTNLDIGTQDAADEASAVIDAAINAIIDARSVVGASQNRIETARVNLATTIENTEAAKSQYWDADIAAEITEFTSKQILLQSGISTLAQANQVPQNLLALFQ